MSLQPFFAGLMSLHSLVSEPFSFRIIARKAHASTDGVELASDRASCRFTAESKARSSNRKDVQADLGSVDLYTGADRSGHTSNVYETKYDAAEIWARNIGEDVTLAMFTREDVINKGEEGVSTMGMRQ